MVWANAPCSQHLQSLVKPISPDPSMAEQTGQGLGQLEDGGAELLHHFRR